MARDKRGAIYLAGLCSTEDSFLLIAALYGGGVA